MNIALTGPQYVSTVPETINIPRIENSPDLAWSLEMDGIEASNNYNIELWTNTKG